MKKLLLLCLLGLLLLPELGHAQRRRSRTTPLKMGITYGFKAGLSYSGFGGKGTDEPGPFGNKFDYSGRAGLVAGGLLNYRFQPELSLQVEVLYTQRGLTRTGSGGIAPYSDQIKTTYVDLPVLIKLNKSFIYLEAGASIGVLLTAEAGKPGGSTFVDVSPQFNSTDFGGILGAGLELPNGIIAGIRYVRGFQAIGSKESGALQLTNKGINNYSFQVTGGYIFNHTSRRGRR